MFGINFPIEESVQKFNKIVQIENIQSEKKMTRPEIFHKIVNEYYDNHCKSFLDQIKNDIFD